MANKKKIRTKPRKTWIPKGILISCKTKENLYKMWKLNPNNDLLKREYKNYLGILKKVIEDAKVRFDISLVESYNNSPTITVKFLCQTSIT